MTKPVINLVTAVHNLTRSKDLITILNTSGLCYGYTKMKMIDTALARIIISTAGTNRVLVAPVYVPEHPISGPMDNFDLIERNLSGTGNTHDTVLVIFQNVRKAEPLPRNTSCISVATTFNKSIKLKEPLPCQKLLHMGNYSK